MYFKHPGSHNRVRRIYLSFLTWTIVLGVSAGTMSTTLAQTVLPQGKRVLDVQRFHPGNAPGDFLGVHGNTLQKHLNVSLSAYLTYLHAPLHARINGTKQTVVQHQLGWELGASIALWERLLFGIELPVSVLQTCAQSADGTCVQLEAAHISDQNFSGGGFGDIRLVTRGVLLPGRNRALGLGVGAIVSFPSGNATSFVGERSVDDVTSDTPKDVFSPTVTAYLGSDYRFDKFRVGANVGVLLRRKTVFQDLEVGHNLIYGVAAGYQVLPWLEAITEFNGALLFSNFRQRTTPQEILLAARTKVGDFRIDVGGGAGITGEYGAPDFRILAGLTYTGEIKGADSDRDGILDDNDSCPLDPEDKDGFQDSDGCPELDDDDDGIPDALDRCIKIAAVTADGCPLADSDGDGIADDRDRCVKAAEDKDGYDDNDGCPDVDNDKDGIADASDKCPNVAETFNSFQDEDGCADDVPIAARPEQTELPKVTATRIDITERIAFKAGGAELTDESKLVLDKVSALLEKQMDLKLIRIEGHTDNTGSARMNKRISEQRAQAVRRYLVAKGISPKRLQAVGYGGSRPIADNKTEEGRAQNRRVEFIIVQR